LLGVDAGEAARLAAVLVQILGIERDDTRIRHLEPEQVKRQIFMATRALVAWRLEAGPLILIVEDGHWADAASIELLGSLADELADHPLMLLLASRPTGDGPDLAGARVPHTIIRLDPLSTGHSERLLAAFFGDSLRRLPERMRALIVERAGGNPLYLEEIVRSLIADAVLVRDGDGWRCAADTDAVQVPSTIQGLLLARIDRLPVPARQLLQEAAVIGPAVDGALLRMVAADADATDAVLETLVNADLLVEAPPDGTDGGDARPRYRFRQGLIREVVYHNLLLRRRTEIHGRVAQALLSGCGGEPQRLEELEALGHHFCLGGDRLEGARYLAAAGDWARGMYANADAVRHYQRALETLVECEGCEATRLSIGERLADLLGPSGEREHALGHYETVETGYRQQGDAVAQARVHRKMGGLHWSAGDRARALECFQVALALLEDRPEHIELAHIYQEMGRLAFRSGDNQQALDWARQALARAERLAALPSVEADQIAETVAAVAHSENTIGAALARLGRPDEAVGHIERSVEVARQHGLLRDACRGLANLGVLYSTLDPGRAIETCTAGLETAKKIGDLGFQSRLYANLAVAYCALTNRCDEEGIGAAHAAIDLDRRLGLLDHLAVPLVVLGQIYQCHGDPPRAIAHYREALALAERSGEPQLLFPCYDGLATVHLDLGDEAQAEHYFGKAQEVCERAGLDPDALVVLPFLD
jgi:predicted ATPase